MEDLRWVSRYSAHWNTLNSFQCVSMGFLFHLMTFSLYRDLTGTNERHQARHHCTVYVDTRENKHFKNVLLMANRLRVFLNETSTVP